MSEELQEIEEKKPQKLEFINRNLMEYSINPDERDDSEELTSWLADHATAPHAEADEFFMWIPPYSGYKRSLRLTYGKEIPEFIRTLLLAAIEVRKNAEDQGYLLIAFL